MDAELLRGLDVDALAKALGNALFMDGGNIERMSAKPRTHHELRAWLRQYFAALSVAQGQGFVMVPRESTSAMDWAGVDAAEREHYIIPSEVAERIWAAMLAAAPAQPDGVE